MSAPRTEAEVWGDDQGAVTVIAHNVSTRYVAFLVDALLSLVMLPFNLAHLGIEAYGLWILTTSFTVYFGMLDLGYGGALVRFVAQYRARRDARALNETLSTLSVVYATIGALTYVIVVAIALNLDMITRLTPEQIATSRTLLLIVGAHVALRFVFGVYGGVIVGFQRYHLNNLTSIATSLVVAAANVLVLRAGHDVVALVGVTTGVRVLALFVYRLNAFRTFPGLAIRWRLFRRERLREITGFSGYMLALDAAYKVNYSSDVLVIGALLGAPAVALWSPAQRLAEVTLRLSNQVSEALFPIVVDSDARQRAAHLRNILVQGTRLSLATVLPLAGGLGLLAHPLLAAWIGPSFATASTIVQILAFVVIVRVACSTASVVLKGAGMHRRLTLLIALMAVGNIALSVALVGPLGLIGVAIGTAVPVTLVASLALFPTACRRVEISVAEMFREALWPALWPAAIAASVLAISRTAFPATLPSLALQLVGAGMIYFVLFLVAVGTEERHGYLRHARAVFRRRPQRLSQVGTANAS